MWWNRGWRSLRLIETSQTGVRAPGGDYAMDENSTGTAADRIELFAGAAWFDPIAAGIRERVRGFIQEMLEQELTTALGRGRHERAGGEPKGYRNESRERQLLGSFGPVRISVPRARLTDPDCGGSHEWRNATLPPSQAAPPDCQGTAARRGRAPGIEDRAGCTGSKCRPPTCCCCRDCLWLLTRGLLHPEPASQ